MPNVSFWLPLVEMLASIRQSLSTAWSMIDPWISLAGFHWPFGILGFIILLFLMYIWKTRFEPARIGGRIRRFFRPDPHLPDACNFLFRIIEEHAELLELPSELVLEASEVAEDAKRENVRLYIFGHQNAGKSSLVNAMLGKQLSPVFPGKCTACLVRVRYGDQARLTVHWPNREEPEKRPLSDIERLMREWADSIHRPRYVIVHTPIEFLGTRNTEIIDSPGTGSADRDEVEKNLEEEIVADALKSTAVAIVVYRYSDAKTKAHESLLRQLGVNSIPTFAICNLDPNWEDEFRKNSKNIQETIKEAEARLRELAKAKCYRIAIEGNVSLVSSARSAGGQTIKELEKDLKLTLMERRRFVVTQTVKRAHGLAEQLIEMTTGQIKRYRPEFEKIDRQKKALFRAIEETQVAWSAFQGINKVHTGAAVGAGVGGSLGMMAFLTVATGGTLLFAFLLAGAGAGVGLASDIIRKEKRREQLKATWEQLRKIGKNSALVDGSMQHKILLSVDSFAERECETLLIELREHASERLQKIPGYVTFTTCQNLEVTLKDLDERFIRFEHGLKT